MQSYINSQTLNLFLRLPTIWSMKNVPGAPRKDPIRTIYCQRHTHTHFASCLPSCFLCTQICGWQLYGCLAGDRFWAGLHRQAATSPLALVSLAEESSKRPCLLYRTWESLDSLEPEQKHTLSSPPPSLPFLSSTPLQIRFTAPFLTLLKQGMVIKFHFLLEEQNS